MKTENTDTTNGGTTFLAQIELAVNAGIRARTAAATTGRADIEAMECDNGRISTIRTQAAIGQIPLLIARAVACSMSWDKEVTVPVMVLNQEDYPGPARRTPFSTTPDELSSNKLRHAGKAVFEYLSAQSFAPRLEYVYDGMTRTYTLQIVVTVGTG